MTAMDFGARGLAAQLRRRFERGQTLARLARGIARTRLELPLLGAVPPAIAAPSATAAVAGTLWSVFTAGAPAHRDRYTLLRGAWRPVTPTYPQYDFAIADAVTRGDGTDLNRTTNAYDGPGNSCVRFFSTAPDLEINFYGSAASGFRLKVDGAYVQAGALGLGVTSPAGGHNIRLTWGDGSAANRRPRLYEIEPLQQFKFGGIRTGAADSPWPAPVEDALKGLIHGDSFVEDTGATQAALNPGLSGQIAALLGQPDTVFSGVGGTGFITNGPGFNTFLQRVDLDVLRFAPDFIIEMGGINDETAAAGDAAVIEAAVRSWLATIVSALPDVLIFMTGPMSNGTPPGNRLAVRDGKKSAAALFPRNVVFIDNIAEEWVTGSGRLNAPAANGNADWVTGGETGDDSTHPTDAGHSYLARRVAQAVASRLPLV